MTKANTDVAAVRMPNQKALEGVPGEAEGAAGMRLWSHGRTLCATGVPCKAAVNGAAVPTPF